MNINDKLNENCGVIAVYCNNTSASKLVHRGLFALQHRGQEAVGIVSLDSIGNFHCVRKQGLASNISMNDVLTLDGLISIGHVRYSTIPNDQPDNIQPFITISPYGYLAISHNGNLKDIDILRNKLIENNVKFSTSMDTEVFAQLISNSNSDTFEDALISASNLISGSYSLTMICGQHLYALRDPYGIRPLVIGKTNNGWVVASETCALKVLNAEYIREVEPGELISIKDGILDSKLLLPAKRKSSCVFELVYFSRPDSITFGQCAHTARINMGKQLAIEDASMKADLVVPVPDSGVPAAIGYSRQNGIPFENAIVRSHYAGRTFILPDQDSRTNAVYMKLSVIEEAVRNKSIVLIDDSIVRGNTSKIIVDMLRKAGASKIFVRVASPPIKYPCFLGIDIPDKNEMIINQMNSISEVCKFIGANDLLYLSIDGLRKATMNKQFCLGCMDGDYPI
jgi:amidophosphoribosyltransferase